MGEENNTFKYKNREEFLDIINKLDLKIGCEIGVYKAEFSLKILENTNISKLYLIDSWKNLDNYNDISNHSDQDFNLILKEVVQKINNYRDRAGIIRSLSEDACEMFDNETLDFIYIDANHSYEESKKDIELWYNKLKIGGVFSGHDYIDGNLPQGNFGVKSAVDEFVKKNNLILHVTEEDSFKSWYIIKPEKTTKKPKKEIKNVNVVLHCTSNYLKNSINLIKTLNIYHDNINFYLYTLNFSFNSNIKNVTSIRFDDSRIINNMNFTGNANDISNKNMFLSVLLKSKILLNSIDELGLEEAIYIDSDILPSTNISKLFDYFDKITNYPLIQNGLFEYQINYGRGNPFINNGFDQTQILEFPLMNEYGVPTSDRKHYSVSSIMMYNKNCRKFIEECDIINEKAFDMSVEDIKYYYPFSDETTMNVLLWKYKYNDRLPLFQMNINEVDNIKEFYESNYTKEKIISSYVRIPPFDKKSDILFFHGIKGKYSDDAKILIHNIFNVRTDFKDNRIYISSNLNFDRELKIVFFDANTNDKILERVTHFNNDIEYWYSSDNPFYNFNKIKIEIYDYDFLIFNKTIKNDVIIKNNRIIKKPLVSVIGCFGDILNSTPTIREISKAYDCKVVVCTSSPEIFINNPYIEEVYDISDLSKFKDDYEYYELGRIKTNNDTFVKHIRKTHLVDYFSMDLGFTLTNDNKHLDFFPDEFEDKFNLPKDYICINPSVTWESKTWSKEKWENLIRMINENSEIKIVILGKTVKYDKSEKTFFNINGNNIIDLTNKTTLSDAYHIINNSKFFITMDSGLLHLAGTTDVDIIQLGSSIDPFSKTPYRNGTQKYKYEYISGECNIFCASNLKYNLNVVENLSNYPPAQKCLENYDTFKCHPTTENVYNKIKNKL